MNTEFLSGANSASDSKKQPSGDEPLNRPVFLRAAWLLVPGNNVDTDSLPGS